MIVPLLRKEVREQLVPWLGLALGGVLVFTLVPWLAETKTVADQLALRFLLSSVAVALAWVYGLICGAMLLAGEQEAGTQDFLDQLPAGRWLLWRGKTLAGVLFLLGQVVLLAFLIVLCGEYRTTWQILSGMLAIAVAGLFGYSWGLYFSSRSVTVIGSIAKTVLFQAILLPLFLILAVIITWLGNLLARNWGPRAVAPVEGMGQLFFIFVILMVLLLPLPLSAARYCKPDTDRQRILLLELFSPGTVWQSWKAALWLTLRQMGHLLPLPLSAARYCKPDADRQRIPLLKLFSPGTSLQSWRSALWLTLRQMGHFPLWLTVGCVIAALLLPGGGPLLWLPITLLVGTLCGLWMFIDDQKGGYRFLGDQGLPLWRIWVVRNLVYGGLALAMLLILLVPLVLQYVLRMEKPDQHFPQGFILIPLFGRSLLTETASQGWFLLAAVVYGFVVGQFAGLLFRKPIVSLVIGLGLAILLLGIWAPSIVLGGVHTWQILAIPLLLLLVILWLLHAWATDRFASRRVVVGLAGMTGLGVALTTLGLWYRVHEIPDVPEPASFAEFVASIPSPEKNEAGRIVQQAIRREGDIRPQFGISGHGWRPFNVVNPLLNKDQAQQDERFYQWLEKGFEADKNLIRSLMSLPKMEIGMLEAVTGLNRDLPGMQGADSINRFLQALALRKQQMGDPELFVDYLDAGLALIRTLQNGGNWEMLQAARTGQQGWCEAVRVWLSQLSGRADLLRRVAEILDRHRKWMPSDFRQNLMAEYRRTQQRLENPFETIAIEHEMLGRDEIPFASREIVSAALFAPWEKARLQRRVCLSFSGERTSEKPSSGDLLLWIFSRYAPYFLHRTEVAYPYWILEMEAVRLMVALRLFQAEKGKPADKLDQLVPKYIAAIPLDPFGGKERIRYRLSKGEIIAWPNLENDPPDAEWIPPGGPAVGGMENIAPPQNGKKVLPGQGILWSVGPDGQDDGGTQQSLRNDLQAVKPGKDLIFLVPLPGSPAKKP